MNQKTIGLFGILVLAVFALGLINEATAANVGTQDNIGRQGYQPDKVCGDRLCSDNRSENVGSQDNNGRPGYQPGKVCGDRLCADSNKNSEKVEKQTTSTNSSEYDALTAEFAKKTQELRFAEASGDIEKVSKLTQEISDLRKQITKWKQ